MTLLLIRFPSADAGRFRVPQMERRKIAMKVRKLKKASPKMPEPVRYRGFAGICTAVLVFSLVASIGLSSRASEQDPYTVTLYAGQDTAVGVVTVWNDLDTLYVTYALDASNPWFLMETHLAVATSLAGIPQARGNPIPGHFAYSQCHDDQTKLYTYEVPLPDNWDASQLLYIAAHAAVSGGESAWAGTEVGAMDFPGKNWATYFTYGLEQPFWNIAGDWVILVNGYYDHEFALTVSQCCEEYTAAGGWSNGPATGVPFDIVENAMFWVVGDTVEFHSYYGAYDDSAVYNWYGIGDIAPDGTMSGTWEQGVEGQPGYQSGTWASTSGAAVVMWC